MGKKKNKTDESKIKYIIEKYRLKWVINISIITFLLAILISFTSEALLRNLNIYIAFIVLLIIILLGVVFDLIGIAVATARIEPFNAMASKKIHGAKQAIKLIKNAGPVSNFCNDVIGDIAGIISGAAGAIILVQINKYYGNLNTAILSIVLSGIVAAITVGGKALGKEIAIRNSKKIVFFVAKILYWIKLKLKIDIIPNEKRRKKK